jgi:hypothetical protein
MVARTQPQIPEEGTLVQCISLPTQKQFNGHPFPLILSPMENQLSTLDALQTYLETHASTFKRLMRFHGAILFYGFTPLTTGSAREFNDVVEALGMLPLPYVGGAAPRTQVHKGVFTSNESPPSEKIPFHSEMAQVPQYPSYIYFYCDQAPKSGGATPILRNDILYTQLMERVPEFVKALESKGVKYTRVLPPHDDPTSAIGRSWRSTFLTEEKDEAERKAKALGVSLEWLPDGNVKSVSGVLKAVKTYPGEQGPEATTIFFNSMVAAYTGWKDSRNSPEKAVTFGDGTPLRPEDVNTVREVMEEICVDLQWQKGDWACIDNNLCMHARRTFEPPRRVLAYVAK